jgi:hypothetical protein
MVKLPAGWFIAQQRKKPDESSSGFAVLAN